jgi:hypothetical protein
MTPTAARLPVGMAATDLAARVDNSVMDRPEAGRSDGHEYLRVVLRSGRIFRLRLDRLAPWHNGNKGGARVTRLSAANETARWRHVLGSVKYHRHLAAVKDSGGCRYDRTPI